jgi:hypothetical protein
MTASNKTRRTMVAVLTSVVLMAATWVNPPRVSLTNRTGLYLLAQYEAAIGNPLCAAELLGRAEDPVPAAHDAGAPSAKAAAHALTISHWFTPATHREAQRTRKGT